jgi:hypothetical protein
VGEADEAIEPTSEVLAQPPSARAALRIATYFTSGIIVVLR